MNPNDFPFAAVVMGGSAGALEALSLILPALPAAFPLPILIVVHVPADPPSVLAELLQSKCALRVKEAEDKEPIEPGTVYFAPPDYHLLVEVNGAIALSCDDPLMYSRPSIDVLFESAADYFGETLLAVVLSGANSDGAAGALAIQGRGGRVLVQAPDSAYVRAMPQAALDKCPDAVSLSALEIAAYLEKEGEHD